MKCPQCGFDNREGIKFCEECGSKLELVCPSCKAQVPLGRKFCGECGQNLVQPIETLPKDLSFDEKLAKIQKYLPSGLTEKILAQRDRIEGERKHVTVMFCDMVGFTPLVERLGPEDAYALMDRVQEILIHKVHEYEGTVNQLTGDGLMALFGAPIALEDAPQRAIRSSLAIHREMTRFSEKIREESGFPAVKMRIGINTGPVVVGTVGNDLRVEFAAVGDTVNTASRMECLAEPGTTYVTEETFKLTEGFFRFEALGTKEVKGKQEAVNVYRVLAPSSRRTRFDVSAERGLTTLVGRERELEIMLDAFERAKGGRGQAVSIVGEAGVGKSRLLYEFRKAVANEDRTFLEGKCLSYSRGMAYHPIIDVLKSNFGIQEENGDREIREKVKRGLQILDAEESTTLPYLLEILSVKDSGIDKIPMSPEARRERISEALKRIVLKGSVMRPLILAFEDLHWMDKSSEDLSKRLLESIPGVRILLIFTYRPEFVHTWGAKSYHSQLNLTRLSNWETLTMVTGILNAGRIEPEVEDLILEKTEGIPFFIEEFVRSLQDLGIITVTDNHYFLAKEIKEVRIPSTIQEMIMARVDSLSEPAKELLQTGSVIEREFSYELIKAVSNLPEQELLSHLSILKDTELLYERGIYPECTYVFKHALTHEVVYDSLLSAKRQKLHDQIARAIEELHREDLREHFGVLANHYIASEDHDRGAYYAKMASEKAEKIASIHDSIAYCRKRLTCLEKLPKTEEIMTRLIDARTVLGFYFIQMRYMSEAKEAVDPILDSSILSHEKKRLPQILAIVGIHAYSVEEDFPKAFASFEKALDIAQEIRDLPSLGFAKYWFGVALCWDCQFEKGGSQIEEALSLSLAANNLWLASITKSGLSSFAQWPPGRFDLSYRTSSEAVLMAEQSGDILSKAIAYVGHGMSSYGKGFLEEATEYLLKGIDLCQAINLFIWPGVGQFFQAEVLFKLGDYSGATDRFRRSVELFEHARSFPFWLRHSKLNLAKAKIINREKGIDLESLYALVDDIKARFWEGWMRLPLAEILMNIGEQHFTEAQHWIEKAIEADERNGMRFHLGQDYAVYADLCKRKGDRVRAKEQLGKAIEIYKECGADGWVNRAEEEMAKML